MKEEEILLTEKEAWDLMKKVHDDVKEHPFWLNFDKTYYMDVREKLRELIDIFFTWYHTKNRIKTTPQEPILLHINHDTNQGLYTYECFMGTPKYLILAQGFLTLVHEILEKKNSDKTIFGYPNSKWRYLGIYADGDWKLKLLYPDKESIIKHLDILKSKGYKEYAEKQELLIGKSECEYWYEIF